MWRQMEWDDATWRVFPEIYKKTADVSKNIKGVPTHNI